MLLAVAAIVGIGWWIEQPPAPLPVTAPATEFSADRAWIHLEQITGTEPSPIGSAAGDAVRDHLVAELTRLGLRTEVQKGTGAVVFDGITAGRVENVIATLPGTAATGRLLIGAHYDTTFSGPGATDDKASVATALEIARALVAGPRPRNDVVLLLTDGEEPGLIGAAAYVAQHPDGRIPGVLLNGEGPGNAGSSSVFQTSRGAAGLIAAFAADARYPLGDSLVATAIRTMDNHTDLNVLDEAGYEGLTVGFNDGRAYYHSSQDLVANFDRASLQQHGANLLALARGFADRDLPTLFSGTETTFFTLFGFVIAYPDAAVLPLAVFALLIVVALGLLARRRGLTSGPRLLAGVGLSLLPLAAAALLAVGMWELLTALRPGYGALFSGEPYRPVLYRLAIAALTGTVVIAWLLLLRRRIGWAGLAIGGLVWPAVIGIVLAATAPGMAFTGTVPALLAAAGGLVAVAVGRHRPVLRSVVWAIGIAPAVLLLFGISRTLLQAFGIAMGAAGAICLGLLALVALPVIADILPAAGRRAVSVPAVAAVLSVALVVAGFGVDRFDDRHPQPTNLSYVLDADAGTARWISGDTAPPEWTRHYAGTAVQTGPDATPLPYRTRPRWSGPAPAAPLAAPQLTVRGVEREGDTTVVRVHVHSARDADVLVLHANRAAQQITATTADAPPVSGMPTYSAPEAWPTELQYYDPPAEGITVELRVADAAGLEISLADYTATLAGLPGFTPRPAELTRGNEHDSDLTVVTTRHRI